MMHGFFGKCHRWCHNKGIGLLILRVMLGSFFIAHAVLWIQNASDVAAMFVQAGHASFWAYAEMAVELVAGVAMVVGAFLWVAGPLLVISNIAIIFAFIRPSLVLQQVPFVEGYLSAWGEYAIFAAAALALAFTGAGRYSLAAWWMRRRGMWKCRDCASDHGMECRHCDWGRCSDCKECTDGKCAGCDCDKCRPAAAPDAKSPESDTQA